LLTGKRAFAGLTALLFAVQPGYAEAVAWVAATSDLLLALWYLLALWMHLLFLRGRGVRFYAISLAAFAICLLTHESSATLLPMMIALEVTVVWERGDRVRGSTSSRRADSAGGLAGRALRYAPFALLLAGYLALEYVVNSRSYLVTEGHYQFGWHAVPHALQYLITLYVGRRDAVSYVLTAAVIAVLLLRGTPPVRFLVLWMLVTIAPASFFTWGNVSRYLYLPAAGFAMLLAEAILTVRNLVAERVSPRGARAAAIALTAVLGVRFAVFAAKVPAGFREWTRPYERYVAAIRKANPAPSPGSVVYVDRADARGVPATYRDPAGAVAHCGADVRVVVR